MSQKLLAMLSVGAIALSAMPAAVAGTTARTSSSDTLTMVMVDQAKLSGNQREAFQQFLQTTNLPQTKVGRRCQYYGRPQVWCLLLDAEVAQQVYQKIRGQSGFGSAAELKEVRRIREANPQRSRI